jgi:hypothetical protein
MPGDNERTAVVAVCQNAFEAETIAAALRERNVDARVFDAATSVAWGMSMGPVSGVKVVVLEHELDAARLALDDIRVESASIDWDAVDLGSDPQVQRLAQVSRARRWVWTVVLLLVPAGFVVFQIGSNRGDVLLKTLGATLLAAAIIMGGYQMMPDRRE